MSSTGMSRDITLSCCSAWPTLQTVLMDGFGEAVMVCDMPEPCEFLSLDNCLMIFL